MCDPPFVSEVKSRCFHCFSLLFLFESSRKHHIIKSGDLDALFGDVLHHIHIVISSATHPFKERQKFIMENKLKEVSAKLARILAPPVWLPEFPVTARIFGHRQKFSVSTETAYCMGFRLLAEIFGHR